MAPAAVPETVLRKRRRDEEWAAKKAAAAAEVSVYATKTGCDIGDYIHIYDSSLINRKEWMNWVEWTGDCYDVERHAWAAVVRRLLWPSTADIYG